MCRGNDADKSLRLHFVHTDTHTQLLDSSRLSRRHIVNESDIDSIVLDLRLKETKNQTHTRERKIRAKSIDHY